MFLRVTADTGELLSDSEQMLRICSVRVMTGETFQPPLRRQFELAGQWLLRLHVVRMIVKFHSVTFRIMAFQTDCLRRFHQNPSVGGGMRIMTGDTLSVGERWMLHREVFEYFSEFVTCETENLYGISQAVFEFGSMGVMADRTTTPGHRSMHVLLVETLDFVLMTGETLLVRRFPDNVFGARITVLGMTQGTILVGHFGGHSRLVTEPNMTTGAIRTALALSLSRADLIVTSLTTGLDILLVEQVLGINAV